MGQKSQIDISPEELKEALWCARIEDIIRETGSNIILESDEVSAQVKIVRGDLTWFRYKLRSRDFDGPGWKPSPLTDWTYGNPDDKFELGKAVEESVYCLDPRFPLTDRFSKEQAEFIKNPFEALPFENPDREKFRDWLTRWANITSYYNPPYPGYFALRNISGARRHVHESAVKFLRQKKYEYLTAVPTWWHTANICGHLGFRFQYERDELAMRRLNLILPKELEEWRRLSSWIVMLQFWAELAEKAGFVPEEFCIKSHYILRDESGKLITFPLSPKRNLWMMYKL